MELKAREPAAAMKPAPSQTALPWEPHAMPLLPLLPSQGPPQQKLPSPRVKPENTHFLLNILILPAASDACHLNSLQCFQTVYDSSAEQGAHKCSTRTTRKGGT